MATQLEKIKAMATLTACVNACHFALQNFIEVSKPVRGIKMRLNSAKNNLKQLRGLLVQSNTLKVEEQRKLRKEFFGTGGAMYEVLELVALLPDNRIDEFLDIMQEVTKPIQEAANEVEAKNE